MGMDDLDVFDVDWTEDLTEDRLISTCAAAQREIRAQFDALKAEARTWDLVW